MTSIAFALRVQDQSQYPQGTLCVKTNDDDSPGLTIEITDWMHMCYIELTLDEVSELLAGLLLAQAIQHEDGM